MEEAVSYPNLTFAYLLCVYCISLLHVSILIWFLYSAVSAAETKGIAEMCRDPGMDGGGRKEEE